MARTRRIFLNAVLPHLTEVTLGARVDASKIRPGAIRVVHIGKDQSEIPADVKLLDATTGKFSVRREGVYPAGGEYEILFPEEIFMPEDRPLMGDVVVAALGGSHS